MCPCLNSDAIWRKLGLCLFLRLRHTVFLATEFCSDRAMLWDSIISVFALANGHAWIIVCVANWVPTFIPFVVRERLKILLHILYETVADASRRRRSSGALCSRVAGGTFSPPVEAPPFFALPEPPFEQRALLARRRWGIFPSTV